jgi:hypothetical protein
MRWRSSAGLVLTATLVITACTGGAGSPGTSTESPTTAASGPGGTAPAGATAGSSAGASQANGTVEGSITTGEPYAATWTWQPGNAVTDGITLNSDKGTFANINVTADGSISFSSGAPALSASLSYRGTGAQVDVKQVGGFPTVCKISVDNDLTGEGGATIHVKGTLTLVGAFYDEGSAVTGVPSIDCR